MLFHVTPTRNLSSIRERGLDPSYAQTEAALRVVWLVEEHSLLWAIEHVRERHHATDLTLLALPERTRRLTRPIRLTSEVTAQITGWVLPRCLWTEIPLWGLREKCLDLGIASKGTLRRRIEKGLVEVDFSTSFGPLWYGCVPVEREGDLEREIPKLAALEAMARDT